MKGRRRPAERGAAFVLRAVRAFDLLRLRLRASRTPGLKIDPGASSNLAGARIRLEPGAELVIGAGVVTERLAGQLVIQLDEGASVVIGEGTWLRTEVGPVHIIAFRGARIELGPECLLNGCTLSAKQSVRLGRRAWVGPGSRVYDSDQHDRDADHPEASQPIEIGDHVWVSSDVTVLKGVSIGEHSVIGTRSLVTRSIPPHSLAFGQPAEVRGTVGDRSKAR